MKSYRYFKIIVFLAITIAALAILALSQNFTEDTLRIFIRWTAKTTAILFSIAFGVSSFHYFSNDSISKKVLNLRPDIGIAFTVVHTAHLCFLIILQQYFHPVFTLANKLSLMGGGMAYVFMYLMAFTTFPNIKKTLTLGQWTILHTIGGYWIWVIFFRSYLKNVVNKDQEYLLFIIVTTVILLRISRMIHLKFYHKQKGKLFS